MLPSYKGYQFRELVGEQGVSASIHSWQDDGNQAAMHYDIDWADYTNSAFSQIIGYSKAGGVNTAGVRVLNRVLPLNHPFFAWMWATRIQQVQPIGPAGMETAGADPFCEFELARCTIGFQSLPYTVLSDADLLAISTPAGVPDESLRYVEKLTVSQSETIEVQVGAMSYAEMPAALATPWTVVPARKYQTVDKDVLSWTWHRVAHKYLMTTGTDIPGNLKAARNTVNASTNIGDGSWNGYPPGTLLFKNYKLAPVDAPTSPGSLGLPINGPPREWKVELQFVYFDPMPDPTVVNPHRGHNLVPAPQLSTPYWYYATSNPVNGAGGGVPLYQSSDFRKIFQSPQ